MDEKCTITESYMISLDDIDLNLLPIYYEKKKYQHLIQKWSKNNFHAGNTDAYYEFEVLGESMEIDNEDTDLEDEVLDIVNSHTCHICNVDIPKTYIKEHINSFKHQTCMKIAEHAVERIKKRVMQEIDITTNSETSATTYFCEPCAVVVKVKNKAMHEKTNMHKISVTHDRLLNGLLLTYIDKNKVISKAKVTETITKENQEASDIFGESEDEIENVIMDIESEEEIKDKSTIAEKTNLASYIEMISSLQNVTQIHTLSAINDDYIEIKAINGDRVKVSVNNFHGYYYVRGDVQCRVCRELVGDETEVHKFVEKHMKQIMAPLKDKNCVRKLDEIWNHCILCNEIIENIDVHFICSETHNYRLNESLISTIYQSLSPINDGNEDDVATVAAIKETSSNYCSVCDIIVKGKLKSHRSNLEHRYKVWLADKDSKIHYHMKRSNVKDELLCRLCYVPVPNNTEYIDEHINSAEHDSYYKSILTANKIIINSEYKSFCQLCKTGMLLTDEMHHIDGKKHKKLLKRALSKNIAVSANSVPATTDYNMNGINNVAVSNETNIQTRNTQGLPEETSDFIQSLVIERNTNEPVNISVVDVATDAAKKETLTNYCPVCNIIVKGKIRSHRYNLEHRYKEWLADKDSRIHYHMKRSNIKNELFCTVCYVTVPHNTEYIDEHINSAEHDSYYTSILTANKIIITSEYKSYCKLCKTSMLVIDEMHHIDMKKHKKLKGALSKTFDESANSVAATSNNYMHVINNVAINNKTNMQTTNMQDIPEETNDFIPSLVFERNTNEPVNISVINSLYDKDHNKGVMHDKNLKLNQSYVKLQEKSHIDTHNKQEPLKHTKQEIELTDSTNKTEDTDRETLVSFSPKPTEIVPSQIKPSLNASEIVINNSKNKRKIKYLEIQMYNSIVTKSINAKGKLKVTCKVCEVKVPHGADGISVHCKGLKHNQIYDSKLTENKLVKRSNKYFCEYCLTLVAKTTEIEHINSDYHNSRIRLNKSELSSIESAVSASDPKLSAIKTIKSSKAEKRTDVVRQSVNQLEATALSDTSKVNNVIVQKFNIEKQLVGDENKVNNEHNTESILKLKNNQNTDKFEYDNSQQPTQPSITQHERPQIMKLHYQMKTTNNPNIVTCRVCAVTVTCSISNIEVHVKGSRHNSNYVSVLDTNNIKKVENKFYKCERCGIFLAETDILDHSDGKKHKSIIVRTPASCVDANDLNEHRTCVQNDPRNTKEETNEIEKTMPKNHAPYEENATKLHMYSLFVRTDNPNESTCKLSQVKVPNTNIAVLQHMEGSKHNRCCLDFKKPDVFYCNICKTSTDMNKFDHICDLNNILHTNTFEITNKEETKEIDKQALKNLVPDDENPTKPNICNFIATSDNPEELTDKLCQIKVPNTNIAVIEHIEGSKHNRCYLDFKKLDELKCRICKNSVTTKECDHICDFNSIQIQFKFKYFSAQIRVKERKKINSDLIAEYCSSSSCAVNINCCAGGRIRFGEGCEWCGGVGKRARRGVPRTASLQWLTLDEATCVDWTLKGQHIPAEVRRRAVLGRTPHQRSAGRAPRSLSDFELCQEPSRSRTTFGAARRAVRR